MEEVGRQMIVDKQWTLIDNNLIEKWWIKERPLFLSEIISTLSKKGEKDSSKIFEETVYATAYVKTESNRLTLAELEEFLKSRDFQLGWLEGARIAAWLEFRRLCDNRIILRMAIDTQKNTMQQEMLSWRVYQLDAFSSEIFTIGRKLAQLDMNIILLDKDKIKPGIFVTSSHLLGGF